MVMVCFLLMKLCYYVPLSVQTQFWAWIKLASDNFSTVLTRNLRNPRDYAPLSARAVEEMWRYLGLVGTLISMHGFGVCASLTCGCAFAEGKLSRPQFHINRR